MLLYEQSFQNTRLLIWQVHNYFYTSFFEINYGLSGKFPIPMSYVKAWTCSADMIEILCATIHLIYSFSFWWNKWEYLAFWRRRGPWVVLWLNELKTSKSDSDYCSYAKRLCIFMWYHEPRCTRKRGYVTSFLSLNDFLFVVVSEWSEFSHFARRYTLKVISILADGYWVLLPCIQVRFTFLNCCFH